MKRVLITREINQFEEIKQLFTSNNLEPIPFPVIKFSPVDFDFDENVFDYIIFTSSNGVKFFLSRFRPIKPKIIAVGEKTAKTLKKEGYTDVILPTDYSSEGVLKYIQENQKIFKDKKFALVRAVEGIDTLVKQKPDFIQLELIKVYKTDYNMPDDKDDVRQMLEKGDIDFVVFSSPSTVEGFLRLFPDYVDLLNKTKVAVIGKTTKNSVETKGIKVDVIPNKHTFEELVKEIAKYA